MKNRIFTLSQRISTQIFINYKGEKNNLQRRTLADITLAKQITHHQ